MQDLLVESLLVLFSYYYYLNYFQIYFSTVTRNVLRGYTEVLCNMLHPTVAYMSTASPYT